MNIGAYAHGSNPAIDKAIEMIGPIKEFLRQSVREQTGLQEAVDRLLTLAR